MRGAHIDNSPSDEYVLHQCAALLSDDRLPGGWQLLATRNFSRLAHHAQWQIYYKEFAPRSPAQNLLDLIKGSLATRARTNMDSLLKSGFNASRVIAWGKLNGGGEYLFTQELMGESISSWMKKHHTVTERVERWKLLQELGMFVGRLHATGFTHGNLSPDNILVSRGQRHFEFSLINNEYNVQLIPPAGKSLLKNLMQLNMLPPNILSRSDRLRIFRAWHSQMRDLSALEAKLLARLAYRRAMKRLGQPLR